MAELVLTPALVIVSANARINNGYNAGATVTAGAGVYLKSSDSTWRLAQSDGTAEESGYGVSKGIAMHGATAGQPLAVLESGDITIGATVAVGTEYFVTTTAGSIGLFADLSSTNYVTSVGFATSTTVIRVNMQATGIQKA